jgi:hypothetical protein
MGPAHLAGNVDTTRFAPCGNNAFVNNIVYIDDRVTVECNIGPNTDPQSFTFFNNLWFHSEDIFWSGPDLPVTDVDAIFGSDPLFQGRREMKTFLYSLAAWLLPEAKKSINRFWIIFGIF